MKYLVLALCVCAASAASYDKPYAYKPFKPYQAPQQVAKVFTQTVASAPVVAAQGAYKVAEAVVTAPVVAAKAVYDGVRSAAVAPVVAAKNVYVAGKEAEAAILRSDSEVSNEGYNYVYETANGIVSQASGTLKSVDGADVIVSQGTYRYTAPDGTPVEFSYVADENGYQPQSALLPVAPPVPEAILRSLEYIRAHPQKPENY